MHANEWFATSDMFTYFFWNMSSELQLTKSTDDAMNTVTMSTLSVTITSTINDPLSWVNKFSSVFQWMIFVVGTCSNLLVLFLLIFRRPVKYRVTMLFVCSLTVANLVMMLSSAWIQGLLYLDNAWSFGLIPCKIYYALHTVTPYCAMWTLAVLASDRYRLI